MLMSGIIPAIWLLLCIHSTRSEFRHECIEDKTVAVGCSTGTVIKVTWAELGRSAELASAFTCPANHNACPVGSEVPADTCNWKHFCFINTTRLKVDLGQFCGTANYISLLYECVPVINTLNICSAATEVMDTRYIVNDNFPAAVPGEPHECQCTIQRHPEATVGPIYVTLDVVDALLQGVNCHQKLTSTYPRAITSYICSNDLRYKKWHLSGVHLTSLEEKLTLTFEKIDNLISDANFFVVSLKVNGKVKINCTKTPVINTASTTTPAPPLSTTSAQRLNNTTPKPSTALTEGTAIGPQDAVTTHTYIIIGVAVGAAVVVLIAVVVIIVAIRSRRKDARKKSSATPNPPATANARQRHSVYERDESIPEAETSSPPAAASSKPAKHYQPLDANHVQLLGASAGVYDEIKGFKVSDRETKKEPTYYNDVSRPIPADFNPTETYATVDRTKTQTKKKANNDSEGDIIINPYIEHDDKNARPGILAPSQGVDNVSMEPMYDAAVDVNPFAQNDDF